MNTKEMAINKRTALLMFWNAGAQSEAELKAANDKLDSMHQPIKGYWYAQDVSKALPKR